MKELRCGFHFHSRYSDGEGKLPEILGAARAAGLQALCLTDHDSLQAREEGHQGWQEGVLLVVGVELTLRGRRFLSRGGHLVVLGLEQMPRKLSLEEALAFVAEEGALSILPHPEKGSLFGLVREEPTARELALPKLTGVELWSFMHDWIQGLRPWNVRRYHRQGGSRLSGPARWVVESWERELERRELVAVAALDNHARRLPLTGMRFFPYELPFRELSTHLLLEELPEDSEGALARFLEALRLGRVFLARDGLAAATGFSFELKVGERAYPMGAVLRGAPGAPGKLSVRSPREAKLAVLRGSRVHAEAFGDSLEVEVAGPGVYRAVAEIAGRPWVFTNPIYWRG